MIDSHSHLSDERLRPSLIQIIEKSKKMGITNFIQGGVGPEDWENQIQLKNKYPEIGLCFGLHPYWIKDHSIEECEQALDILSKRIPGAVALGETGLDLRPQILQDKLNLQIEMFENQIQLSLFSHKPLVLHLVRAHKESIQILELQKDKTYKGMIHSFNGDKQKAKKYLNLGFYISIGGSICHPENQKLIEAVKFIPLDQILIESDSPDQKPFNWTSELNDPSSIIWVAEKVAQVKNIDLHEVLDRTTENARKLFQL